MNDRKLALPGLELINKVQIGIGSFSTVYKATWADKEVAVKEMNYNEFNINFCRNEQQILDKISTADPEHVVGYYGYIEKGNKFSLIMEYLAKGTLKNYMLNNPAPSWEVRYQMIDDITAGLVKLHEQNIVYSDMKPDNVLLDNNLHAKLCDFGLSLDLTTLRETVDAKGSLAFSAPELLTHPKEHNTKASDIYAWGTLVRSLTAWRQPFEGYTFKSVYKCIKANDQQRIPADCPEKLANLIKHCWFNNPKIRPSAEQLLTSLHDAREEITRPKIP